MQKNLKKQQKARPIKIEEVFTDESFKSLNTKTENDFDVTQQTINFSCLLKQEYQNIINLPADIVALLKDINDTRNRLHFISIDHYFIGHSTLLAISKIKDFVQNIITARLIDLNKNLEALK